MTKRKRRIILSLCMLTGALLLHLAAPLAYRITMMRVKSIQHAHLVAGMDFGGRNEMRVPVEVFERHFDAHERELEINDMRYDVISYSRSGATVICVVVKDEREQQLLNGIKNCSGAARLDAKFPLWFPVYHEVYAIDYPSKPRFLNQCFIIPGNECFRSGMTIGYVSPPPDRTISFC